MKITIVITVLVSAAILLRLYAPTNQDIAYNDLSGVMRGIPVNIAAFWLLITAAIGAAAAFVLRRVF